jgi:hypothetical protein
MVRPRPCLLIYDCADIVHAPRATQVGWVLGVAMLLVSAAGSIYSGVLIDAVAAHVGADPAHGGPPRKYADLGRAAFGARGETIVKATQYAFLAGCIVAVQLTASQSLHTVIHALHGKSCLVVCNTIIAVTMLPIMQLQVLWFPPSRRDMPSLSPFHVT